MMNFIPPFKIEILSDGNVIEYVEPLTPKGKQSNSQVFYIYKYIVSKSKLGTTVGYTEKEINDNIRKDIFKVIRN